MKQSEVEAILAKVRASVEASHRAQVELLQAVRQLFVEQKAMAKPKTSHEIDPDIELAALDEAKSTDFRMRQFSPSQSWRGSSGSPAARCER